MKVTSTEFQQNVGRYQDEDIDDDTLRAIAASEVPAEHVALSDLIKDWNP